MNLKEASTLALLLISSFLVIIGMAMVTGEAINYEHAGTVLITLGILQVIIIISTER